MIRISDRNGHVLIEYKNDLQTIYRYIKKHTDLLKHSVFNKTDIKIKLRTVNHMHRPRPLMDKNGAVEYDRSGDPVYGDGKNVYRLSMSKAVFDSLVGVLASALEAMVKDGRIGQRTYSRWLGHATPQADQRLQSLQKEAEFAERLRKIG